MKLVFGNFFDDGKDYYLLDLYYQDTSIYIAATSPEDHDTDLTLSVYEKENTQYMKHKEHK